MVAVLTTIIVGVAVAIAFVFSLMLCVCGKAKETRSRSGNRQNHAEDNLNNNQKQEEVTVRQKSNDVRSDQDPERADSARPKTLTMNRKLPEIPHIALNDSSGELYATVAEATRGSTHTSVIHNESGLSSLPSGPAEPLRNRPVSSKSLTELQQYEESHSYAKLKGQTSGDRDTDTDTYCDPQVYTKARTDASRSWDPTLYEPPPVPEKHFESSEKQPTVADTSIPMPSAASAMAGNPSTVDIPFMTSPVHSTQNLAFVDDFQDLDAYSRGGSTSSEIRYTSISVREPLANIRAQMMQQAMASGVAYAEPHYSVVSEDGDQMYAEIESAHNSAASSTTYTRIGIPPDGGGGASSSYPPAPPTVESLRTVAQAHSRHASSSSCISDSSHPNSPGTEHSFVMNTGPRPTSPDVTSMYSTVDKSKKIRSTVHVMENGPAGGELLAIEDMYAKVKKNRPQAVKSVLLSATELGARSKYVASALYTHPRQDGTTAGILRRKSSGKDDPGYEKIREGPQWHRNASDDGSETDDAGLSSEFSHVEIRKKKRKERKEGYTSKAEYDPGYEVVKSESTAPGYEAIKERFTFEDEDCALHGYEKVKKPDSDNLNSDPGYERVRGSSFSTSDPGYESVRYAAASDAASAEFKGGKAKFWSAQSSDEDSAPLYERINCQEEDQLDPNYEKVKTVSEISYDNSDPGYERVGNNRNAPVEDGYERIHECGDAPYYEQVDPGYELIKDRRGWPNEQEVEEDRLSGDDGNSVEDEATTVSLCLTVAVDDHGQIEPDLFQHGGTLMDIDAKYKSDS